MTLTIYPIDYYFDSIDTVAVVVVVGASVGWEFVAVVASSWAVALAALRRPSLAWPIHPRGYYYKPLLRTRVVESSCRYFLQAVRLRQQSAVVARDCCALEECYRSLVVQG